MPIVRAVRGIPRYEVQAFGKSLGMTEKVVLRMRHNNLARSHYNSLLSAEPTTGWFYVSILSWARGSLLLWKTTKEAIAKHASRKLDLSKESAYHMAHARSAWLECGSFGWN